MDPNFVQVEIDRDSYIQAKKTLAVKGYGILFIGRSLEEENQDRPRRQYFYPHSSLIYMCITSLPSVTLASI